MKTRKKQEKILYLHAGGAKTGSSAIQHFCETYNDKLLSAGYSYLNTVGITHKYEITSGNGFILYELILSEVTQDDDIKRGLLSYFGNSNKAICSSEYFELLTNSEWQRLIKVASSVSVSIHVVFYVRNVIPFFLSHYDQQIKRHGEYRSFEEWLVDQQSWQHRVALSRLDKLSDKIGIDVLSYDRLNSDLVESFLRAIGCDVSLLTDCLASEKSKKINRSLTSIERFIMLEANKFIGDTYSAELSDSLIYTFEELASTSIHINDSDSQRLSFLFKHDVEWINDRFGKGLELVKIAPDSFLDGNGHVQIEQGAQDDHGELRHALLWAFQKIGAVKKVTEDNLIGALRSAEVERQNSLDANLPDGFDHLAYLLLNPDVLRAGVDAAEHYLNCGKQEGRFYRFIDSQKTAVFLQDKRDEVLERDAYLQQNVVLEQLITELINKADVYGLRGNDLIELSNRIAVLEDEKNMMCSLHALQIKEYQGMNQELADALSHWQQRVYEMASQSAERERQLYARLLEAQCTRLNKEPIHAPE